MSTTKAFLELLRDIHPPSIKTRRKVGFSVPLDSRDVVRAWHMYTCASCCVLAPCLRFRAHSNKCLDRSTILKTAALTFRQICIWIPYVFEKSHFRFCNTLTHSLSGDQWFNVNCKQSWIDPFRYVILFLLFFKLAQWKFFFLSACYTVRKRKKKSHKKI